MAYEESLRSISLDADDSLAKYTGVPGLPGSSTPNYGPQYSFVKVTGAHQVGLVTAAADLAVGVLQNKPQVAGQAATVGYQGVTNVLTGEGGLTAGDQVSSDDTGHAITASGGTAFGIALTSAPAGALASVLLRVN